MKLFKRILIFSAVLLLLNAAFYFYINGFTMPSLKEGRSIVNATRYKPLKPLNVEPVIIDIEADNDSPHFEKFERAYVVPEQCQSLVSSKYKDFCDNHKKLSYKAFIDNR